METVPALAARLRDALHSLWPAPLPADLRERARVAAGAAVGIALAALLCRAAVPAGTAWPWLVAPLGASAVLVFGVPTSPLAQPWAVLGGNTLSALVGVACARWIGPPEAAAALAVGGAIALMFALRCLHPPGGASALLAVLAGVHDWRFALFPVAANALLLVLAGVAWNRATRRPYPVAQRPAGARDDEARAIDADLDAVLARYNQVLDVGREDLKALLQDAQLRGYRRKLEGLRCRDIMSARPVTVHIRTPLPEAWALFARHRVKALPVVDRRGSVVGIVTRADFLRAAGVAASDGAADHQRKLSRAQGDAGATVAGIMTRRVRVASADRHLAELLPLFSSTGHHHLPIVDAEDRLVGMVTQTDVVAALAALPQAVTEAGAEDGAGASTSAGTGRPNR